jgi:transposase InsO family protein
MKRVELYARVRHAVMIDGLSQREAARCFGIDPRTVRKMLSYSVPPGYIRTRPPVRPKLDPFIGVIDSILEEDKERPKKQGFAYLAVVIDLYSRRVVGWSMQSRQIADGGVAQETEEQGADPLGPGFPVHQQGLGFIPEAPQSGAFHEPARKLS